MEKFVINGGRKLEGSIRVGGMKNAATPILVATLLTTQRCTIRNVPRISDVDALLELIQSLGAVVEHDGSTVTIEAKQIGLEQLDKQRVKAMRSSILLLGPLLARLGSVTLPYPGGCIIGNRPIDDHLEGLKLLGANVEDDGKIVVLSSRRRLTGAEILMPHFSVTATENLLMAAATAKGTTTIQLAAAEPHVQDLTRCLIAMGARIEGLGTHRLVIRGVDTLSGVDYTIIPDQIEAGTFAVAAAVTHGRIRLEGIVPDHLQIILYKLRKAGVRFRVSQQAIDFEPSPKLEAFNVQALPFPGFPTDLQAPFAVLATQATGTSLIHDPIYEGRLGYVQELIKMGANAVVCDPHRVLITGPTPLYGEEIRSFDLRAGATLIVAGLIAQGETVIHDAQTVDRGYERIEERLASVGASIRRLPE